MQLFGRMETSEAARANGDPMSGKTPESALVGRMLRVVRDKPLLSTGAAAAIGTALGGLVFYRLGRLAFFAMVGAVGNEVWRREGRLDIDELVSLLASDRDNDAH
jgi:hypothetical protein